MSELTPREEPPAAALIEIARERTPARIFVGRSGPAYRTETQLTLRADHAAARDAVWAEVDLSRDLPDLPEVRTRAVTKEQYLLRPDLGRQLDDASPAILLERCPRETQLQVFIGDGLSAAAVSAHFLARSGRITVK